jgi:nicotinamide mononucleotide adenylyltransferase
MPRSKQASLFPDTEPPQHKEGTSGSFVGNLSLPVHRWFRYSAGFNASWAEALIAREAARHEVRVFDPFAGSGTTLIAAEQCGVASWGIDPHPFVARVAQAKLAYRSSSEAFLDRAKHALASARRRKPSLDSYTPLIRKCYADDALAQLDCLRRTIAADVDDSEASRLVWLTLAAILRSTSHVGTANWQYLLPNRRKARVQEPFAAFEAMASTMHRDMIAASGIDSPRATFTVDDARSCGSVPSASFNLVVTSPPYPNNYDYADATRLELTFFGEIEGWGDLQESIRQHLLRSCTQHVPDSAVDLAGVLDRPELAPIRDELRAVCAELGEVRLTRGGKKTYHNMVGCYFLDLAQVWQSLRRVCSSPSRVCFVIGDSAPYGVYVPAVEWLGKLALAAGFESFTFERTRDRNTKWKNRKHRVPLCEGRLWVEG